MNFIKERDPNLETPVARTGKGYHIFLAHPGGTIANAVALGGIKGMDLRADGGYVVAPPSIHPSGRHYEWIDSHSPDNLPLARCPEWLLALIRNPSKMEAPAAGRDPSGVWELLQGVPQGQRNDAATRLVGHWLGKGLPEDEAWLLLQEWNAKNSPPLSERELKTVFESIARREARKPKHPNGDGERSSLGAKAPEERAAPVKEKLKEKLTELCRLFRLKGEG